jgi:hypothetical protein
MYIASIVKSKTVGQFVSVLAASAAKKRCILSFEVPITS